MSKEIDLLQLLCVGGRLNPQPSKALPQRYYGDPARTVRFASETACKTCLYGRGVKAGQTCKKGKTVGKRCEFYRMAKK